MIKSSHQETSVNTQVSCMPITLLFPVCSISQIEIHEIILGRQKVFSKRKIKFKLIKSIKIFISTCIWKNDN